jgi:hypothetical protein
MPDTMSFIYDDQNYNIFGDNLALSTNAPLPDHANSEQVNYLNISIYLSGLNNHVTTISSDGNTVIHEQGDYTTFTALGGSLTIYGFAAHDIIDLRTNFGITGANALAYVQPDGHGGTLIGGGSNALHDVSGDVASIDLVGVAPSQLTAAQFA